MIMNPFEQSKQQLLHALTSQVEQEVIDYIRQEMQHDAPDSIPKKNCSPSSNRRTNRLNWTPTNKYWRPTDCWSMQRSVCAPSAT